MNDMLNIEMMPKDTDRCIDCGQIITGHNDSGGMVFTEDGRTQAICWVCYDKRSEIILKWDDSDEKDVQ